MVITAQARGNRVEITCRFEAKSMEEIVDMAAHMLAAMSEEDRYRVLVREAEIRATGRIEEVPHA